MATAKTYRELEIWREAMEVCEEIYRITDEFPKKEQFTLTSQMRRASISIPSNIAEGFVRKHAKEFRRFLSISLGSLAELDTQILLSVQLGYLRKNEAEDLLMKTEILGRKTTNFYKRIRI
jgi:four helix bundle protein